MNKSQNQKIIETLLHHSGAWVTLPYLMDASGSMNVHSRISELRTKRGYTIKQRNNPRYTGNNKHSEYMLVGKAVQV